MAFSLLNFSALTNVGASAPIEIKKQKIEAVNNRFEKISIVNASKRNSRNKILAAVTFRPFYSRTRLF
jgi:hypothetical protein